MTVSIKDKEKVGIVGRTGAGKSSITVALYRLVNPHTGTIRIGGVNTQDLGMCQSRLSVLCDNVYRSQAHKNITLQRQKS